MSRTTKANHSHVLMLDPSGQLHYVSRKLVVRVMAKRGYIIPPRGN